MASVTLLRNTFLSDACNSAALGSVSAVKQCYSVMVAYRSAGDTINFGKAECSDFLDKFSLLYIVSIHGTAVVKSGSGQHLYNCSSLKCN